MGNNPSSSQKQSAGQSPHIGTSSNHDRHDKPDRQERVGEKSVRQEPKRRESIHALSAAHPKAQAAPPSASLSSAVAQPVTAVSTTSISSSPTQKRSDNSKSSHTRNRSATIATPHLHPQDSPANSMGNDTSKPARERSTSRGNRTAVPPPEIKTSSESQPVNVPGAHPCPVAFEPSPLDPTAPPSEAYQLPQASYSRPPRLPLPIEEEDYTPGSPILSPTGDEVADSTSPIEQNEAEGGVTEDNRRGSVVSSNVDDDDEEKEYQGYLPESGANAVKVPTIIEWRDATPTDKIYVTGTFTDWQRKYRLHWNGPSKNSNTVSATLQLPPGTHHVKFLVNNDMLCSTFLPTTVDFTNILVNYIEVSAPPTDKDGKTKAAAPVAVPPPPSKPMDIRPKPVEQHAVSPMRGMSPSTKPQTYATSPAATPARASPRVPAAPTPPPQQPSTTGTSLAPSPSQKPRPVPRSPKTYTTEIPAYLLDLDTWPPPSSPPPSEPANLDPSDPKSRFHRANAATQHFPKPPSLPLFLNKSILNGATPMKDDSSVLIMPNHTVLNHLATTNIKNGVLAVSGTTRYKKKFLTTIMYKPRSEDGD